MNKAEWIATMKRYEGVNVHQKPVTGIDSGAHGKAVEMNVNLFFDAIRGKAVKAPKQADAKRFFVDDNGKRHAVTFEIKCGNGTVATTFDDEKKLDAWDFFKADFIIYCPFFFSGVPIEKQCFILSRKCWNEFVNGVHGLRIAKDRNGNKKVMFVSNFSDKVLRNSDDFCDLESWYDFGGSYGYME